MGGALWLTVLKAEEERMGGERESCWGLQFPGAPAGGFNMSSRELFPAYLELSFLTPVTGGGGGDSKEKWV